MSTGTIWTAISIVNYLAVLAAIEQIIRRGRDPRGSLAWIAALLLLPGLGLLLYLLIGDLPIQRKVRKRRRRYRRIERALRAHTRVLDESHDAREAQEIDPELRSLMIMMTRMSGDIVTTGNQVEIYHDAERTFLAMSLAMQAARRHIHLEYYILAADDTGRAVRDLLIRKAREGVRVRVLLDAVGCLGLPAAFIRPMREAGIEVAFFGRWRFSRRGFHMNFRNHRKSIIIDGRIGFLGSQNIGDVYLGRKKKFGPWRDEHLRVSGPAVTQLQEVFVEDWHDATGKDLTSETYFPTPERSGREVMQIVPTGPDRRGDLMHHLLYAALADARKTISFVTPYFVPDRAMLLALRAAAHRGVSVRLMVPRKSDHWFTSWAARSYYEEMLEAGVEILEYPDGMLHSKVVVIDQRWSMVGSANMDERSFRLSFELTSILYGAGLAQDLSAQFESLRKRCAPVTAKQVQQRTYRQKMAAGTARLATPLL